MNVSESYNNNTMLIGIIVYFFINYNLIWHIIIVYELIRCDANTKKKHLKRPREMKQIFQNNKRIQSIAIFNNQ